jgi:hypothetical protein
MNIINGFKFFDMKDIIVVLIVDNYCVQYVDIYVVGRRRKDKNDLLDYQPSGYRHFVPCR